MNNPDLKRTDVARVVDAQCAPCPGTLFKVAGIREVLSGEAILSDNPEARGDLPARAVKIGHELPGILESEG